MSDRNPSRRGARGPGRQRPIRLVAFPMFMASVYAIIAVVSPQHAVRALKASGRILLEILPALAVAFGVMVLLNLLVRRADIKRLLGGRTKAKGTLVSSAAGILSMGSIYAWYPVLKDFREKGMSDFHLATFVGCRAVKIPLLPMMAAYFGWAFTLIVSVLMVCDAFLTAVVVSATTGGSGKARSQERSTGSPC